MFRKLDLYRAPLLLAVTLLHCGEQKLSDFTCFPPIYQATLHLPQFILKILSDAVDVGSQLCPLVECLQHIEREVVAIVEGPIISTACVYN
jgi:hypothetical protein